MTIKKTITFLQTSVGTRLWNIFFIGNNLFLKNEIKYFFLKMESNTIIFICDNSLIKKYIHLLIKKLLFFNIKVVLLQSQYLIKDINVAIELYKIFILTKTILNLLQNK